MAAPISIKDSVSSLKIVSTGKYIDLHNVYFIIS